MFIGWFQFNSHCVQLHSFDQFCRAVAGKIKMLLSHCPLYSMCNCVSMQAMQLELAFKFQQMRLHLNVSLTASQCTFRTKSEMKTRTPLAVWCCKYVKFIAASHKQKGKQKNKKQSGVIVWWRVAYLNYICCFLFQKRKKVRPLPALSVCSMVKRA